MQFSMDSGHRKKRFSSASASVAVVWLYLLFLTLAVLYRNSIWRSEGSLKSHISCTEMCGCARTFVHTLENYWAKYCAFPNSNIQFLIVFNIEISKQKLNIGISNLKAQNILPIMFSHIRKFLQK